MPIRSSGVALLSTVLMTWLCCVALNANGKPDYLNQPEIQKVDSILAAAREQHFSNEEFFELLENALEMAQAIPDSTYKLRCMQGLIWSHYYDGNYPEMFHYLRRSKSMAEEYGSPEHQLEWLNSMGYFWHENKHFRKSLDCQFKSFDILENHPDSFLYSKVLNSIGIAYTQLGVLDSGMHYHRVNLPIRRRIGKDRYIGQTLYNIGEVFEHRQLYDSALHYYYQAQIHRRADNYEQGLAWGYHRIGRTYLTTGQLDSAVKHIRKALDIVTENNDHQAVCLFGTSLGETLIAADSLVAGIRLCRNSLHLSNSYTPEESKLACLCLYKGYLARGDSGEALRFYREYAHYKDSLHLADQAVASTRLVMEAGFETREEAFTKQLEARSATIIRIIVISIVVLGLFVFLTYTVWRRWRAEKERAAAIEKLKNEELKTKIVEKEAEKVHSLLKAIEQEKDTLSKELHDGFGSKLYGSILHMQSAIKDRNYAAVDQNVEDLKKGYELLRSAARQMSAIHTEEYTTINELILDELEVYKNISKIAFEFNDGHKIPSQGEVVDTHLVRSLQTLINNVLRHSEATKCTISLKGINGKIRIVIDDNGVGLNHSKEKSGRGLDNVADRMRAIDGTFELQSQYDGGTRAILEFPLHS